MSFTGVAIITLEISGYCLTTIFFMTLHSLLAFLRIRTKAVLQIDLITIVDLDSSFNAYIMSLRSHLFV